jgi:hypothetical protein
MVDAGRALLEGQGVAAEDIHREPFVITGETSA